MDPTLAITQLDIGEMRAQLIYCLTIPIFLFIVSCSYLMYAYCVLYAGDPVPPDAISLRLEDEQDAAIQDVVVDQPVSLFTTTLNYCYDNHFFISDCHFFLFFFLLVIDCS